MNSSIPLTLPPVRAGAATIDGMTVPHSASSRTPAPRGSASRGLEVVKLAVLLYSDDRTTRDAVRVGVGRRPARDVEITAWRECATAPAVTEAVHTEDFDVLILDGEAQPYGGLGLCRELKNEVYNCPPVLVLIGRANDGWLGAWSQAEAVVPHPLDALALSSAVAELGRARPSGGRPGRHGS